MEVSEAEESEDERSAAEAAVVAGFGEALKGLAEMRRTEGQALGKILSARLSEIGALAARAEATPGRKPEAIKARLAEQVATLLEASQRFDADRLHQEAIMLATKIDIREELDRLVAHVEQAQEVDRRRRADRAQARLSVSGAQPRIEYAVLQGQRPRTDQHRAGAQGRGRAIPRAGAEPGIAMARGGKSKAIARRGLMLVLSSPSGAGKTTLSRMLLTEERIALSISVTTRARRPGEVHGRHYHFIDRNRFDQMRKNGDLLEYAEVFGNFYGTPRKPVEKALKQGRDVLFDVDWQGTKQLRKHAPADLVSVFILPPSSGELAAAAAHPRPG